MPIRRFRTALLATAAVTALAVTACGGGGSDGADDEIEGVDQGNSEQQDASASEEPQDDGVDRPEIVLPSGWENVYEGWESDDPVEQAVLNDAAEAQNAVDLAILEREPDADYVRFYHSAEALVGAEEWIGGFLENDRTISGTVRYFNPQVTLQGDSGAALTYCADESDAVAVDVNTGEELPDESGEQFVSYSNLLRKDERGVWVTTALQSERERCGG